MAICRVRCNSLRYLFLVFLGPQIFGSLGPDQLALAGPLGCPYLQEGNLWKLAQDIIELMSSLPSSTDGGPPRQSKLQEVKYGISDKMKLLLAHGQALSAKPQHSHHGSVFSGYTPADEPCIPLLIVSELMSGLWQDRADENPSEAAEFLAHRDAKFRYDFLLLGTGNIQHFFEVGWASSIFGCGHLACELVVQYAPASLPAPEKDLESEAIFWQYKEINGFDYRDCAQRFAAAEAPWAFGDDVASEDCTGPSSHQLCGSEAWQGGAKWPHLAFLALAKRQPFSCGPLCRIGMAYANLAQSLLTRAARDYADTILGQFSADESYFFDAAYEAMGASPSQGLIPVSDGSVLHLCTLLSPFPLWRLLASVACTSLPPYRVKLAEPVPNIFIPASQEVLGCSDNRGEGDYVRGWPPEQRLTTAGSFAIYRLVHEVGSLLDAFGVRWWAAHGTLLGALRHGGLMPHECDADIALSNQDFHVLNSPSFRAALTAAGIFMMQVPVMNKARFCLAHISPDIDQISTDGKLTCRPPYIDSQPSGAVGKINGRWYWSYSFRSEAKYTRKFPLAGLLDHPESPAGSPGDRRQRVSFGSHAEVWVPQFRFANIYLSKLYGPDWHTVVRQRNGIIAYNGSRESADFRSIVAEPSGPLRDIVGEFKLLGIIPA